MTDDAVADVAGQDAMVRPRPHGLGIAVVFDWALSAQLTTQALASATRNLGLTPDPLMIVGALVAAAGLCALGEGVRRGVPALRLVQVVLMMLITVIGVISLVTLLTGHVSGSLVFTTAIELTYPPWLIWRLLDRETAAWFALPREQRRAPRTSGWRWIAVLAVWAVVWGVVVAWAESL
jgi:small-conductance mechanosensitive channel